MLLKMGEDGEWVVWMQGKGEKVMGVGFEGDVGEGMRELDMYEQSVCLFCVGFYEGVCNWVWKCKRDGCCLREEG